jgi:hypothetical protein
MPRGSRLGRNHLLGLIALSLAFGLAQTASARATSMATCPAGLEPYAASAATLAACGDRIVPRVSLTSLSNGATESVYVTPQGRKVRFITPPPSFQSSKASPTELDLYGIPAEPAKDSPEYPKWKAMIDQNIHAQAPPEHLIQASNGPVEPTELSLAAEPGSEPGFFNTGSSAYWGGYVNDVPTGSNENAYTHVTGYYKEPAGSTTFECPAKASSATWVGLGGWATGKETLGQDGTVLRWELKGKERGHHEAFYEVLPKEPVYLNLFGSPGSFMEADTKWVASEGAYHFYLANFKTGKFIAPKAEGEFDGESADFIDEREFGHELFDFEKVTFQAFTNGTAFQKFPTEKIPMYNGKEYNVQVSNVVNKYEFHNTFKSCKKAGTKEEKEYSQLGNGHPAPKVTTGESSEVTGSTAKVGGTVNPEGDNTVYQFEYGTEAANFEESSLPQSAGEGSTTVPVSASLTGLRSGTTYHYRLVASSGNGARDGEERTFKTTGSPPPPPPTVTTEGASGITAYTATLKATVNPNGLDTHYYFEYGTTSTLYESYAPAPPGNDAGSGSTPVQVSVGLTVLAPSTTYYYRIVATNSTGTAYGAEKEVKTLPPWSIQTTPNPLGLPGVEIDVLSGVSCWSATACAAAGYYLDTEGIVVGLVEGWNGTTWEVQPTPNHAGATGSHLESVSCSSSTACTATGYYENSQGAHFTLAEQWNGSTWKVQTTPTSGNSANLASVSCTSATECTAVGQTISGNPAKKAPLVERWNGTEWKTQTVATPSGYEEGWFSGVSCPASNACTAVGSYISPSLGVLALAERWNGTTWSVQATPELKEYFEIYLNGVSCSAASACTAVGEYQHALRHGKEALVERWNGTSWQIQESPNPTGKEAEEKSQWKLSEVSCPSATSCVAIGSYNNSPGHPGPLLGERWNGTSWELEFPINRSGVEFSGLEGISCSATVCIADGYSQKTSTHIETLAERFELP